MGTFYRARHHRREFAHVPGMVILETRFLPEWEERFTVAPRNPRNAHRRLGRENRLEEILSVRVFRTGADPHEVSGEGNSWGAPGRSLRWFAGSAGGNRTAT